MFTDNKNFYPTPQSIIDKMLSGIDFRTVKTVLEPSAGKGNIIETVSQKFKYANYSYNKEPKWDIDAIEIDKNLQYILKGKGVRLVHDDFITYESLKHYDIIIMNPPFDNGEKHLLKALSMQEKGGKIICLLNAETLKNPCNNNRIALLDKLEQYQANIEYISNAFIDAERKTGVEIALIKIDIPNNNNCSVILDGLRKEEQYTAKEEYTQNNVIHADFIKGIVDQYNFEVKAGLKLIEEYYSIKANMFKGCELTVICSKDTNDRYKDSSKDLHNSYIKDVRSKYWTALFMSDKFMGLFTSNLREAYSNKISELDDYDFSLFNIYTIRQQLSADMIKGAEDTILSLFEEFSNKHHYYDETSKNIHYYNGWKTNKAWKINDKVIIPLNGWSSWSNKIDYDYRLKSKLADIEKVFNYLDGGKTEEISIEDSLKLAGNYGETKKIPLKYFNVSFYKKGTCHIEFTNEELLHKFNIFGSKKKGWLPPTYGKKQYKDMATEEKQVVNEFEGEISYNKVINNSEYYITDLSRTLLLAQ
jgi:hypothetical protein